MDKLRVLLDTNIYGKIIVEGLVDFAEKLRESKNIVIYGNQVIRKELRRIPKQELAGTSKLRMATINLFDAIAGKHPIEITDLTNYLALEYAKEYKGTIDNNLFNDYLIVASASLKNLDIVCSDDERTMCAEHNKKIYQKVNKANDLHTPEFIPLKRFEAMLK